MKIILLLSIIILVKGYSTSSIGYKIDKNECIRQKEMFEKELIECQSDIIKGVNAITNIVCTDNKVIDFKLYIEYKRKKCVDIDIITNKLNPTGYDKLDEICRNSFYKSNNFIKKSVENCKIIKEEYESIGTLNYCSIGTVLSWKKTAESENILSKIKSGPQCVVCGEDNFRTKEMSKCNKCPAGYIGTSDKNEKCQLCTIDMFNKNECIRASEEFCGLNEKMYNNDYYTDNPKSCIKCDKEGTFNKKNNQNIECNSCKEGYIYYKKKCIPCPMGTFQKNNKCIECPIMTYNDKIGNNKCYKINDNCPIDSRANFIGATHCGSETFLEKIKRLWYLIIILIIFGYIQCFTGI